MRRFVEDGCRHALRRAVGRDDETCYGNDHREADFSTPSEIAGPSPVTW